jgi:two-component system OmpR family response regulator
MYAPTSQLSPQSRTRRADGSPIRALVVDDEAMLTDLVRMAFRFEGWEVKTAAAGHSALQIAREFKPDVIILDIMLPDIDGLSVLSRLRASGHDMPVVFLTARDTMDDRIAGLTAGGDDYLTKPFSLDELLARVRALIRRARQTIDTSSDSEIVVGDLVLNEDSHEVHRAGKAIDLTATEYELLRYLMCNPRRVLSKSQILDHVWSYDFGGRSSVVEIYISYLRRKVDAEEPRMIHTVRGVGYILKPAEA